MRPVEASEVESTLILRADEMGNELQQLVAEKDEDRAAVAEEAEATLAVDGRCYMLLELCRLMWNNPRIRVALRLLLMSEIEKIKLSDNGDESK